MDSADRLTPSRAFRLTCEMHDLSVAMMRQNLRRRNPHATEREIDEMLRQWLHTRPGAEFGDVSGPGLRMRTPPPT